MENLDLFVLRSLLDWRRSGKPALLATVATLMAFSIVPTINPRIAILGPDPVAAIADPSVLELAALVGGKVLITLTAASFDFFGDGLRDGVDPRTKRR